MVVIATLNSVCNQKANHEEELIVPIKKGEPSTFVMNILIEDKKQTKWEAIDVDIKEILK